MRALKITTALIALLLLGSPETCRAQDSTAQVVTLGPAVVYSPSLDHVDSTSRRYTRLERKVLKVWPYAALAGELMEELAVELEHVDNRKQRKTMIEEREERLMARFADDLKRLRVSEGVILIRLIDRQAGQPSYGVVRELKGRFSAFMWQGLARIFGHNLKSEYDPKGEDAIIEHIIERHRLELQRGLTVENRRTK